MKSLWGPAHLPLSCTISVPRASSRCGCSAGSISRGGHLPDGILGQRPVHDASPDDFDRSERSRNEFHRTRNLVSRNRAITVRPTVKRLTVTLALLLIPAAAFAQGTCPSSVPAGITSCYFISSATGSDSNSGASENSSWAHFPGMPDCTANCAAHAPTAGNGFILRGGDSWLSADLGVQWTWGGTATNPIYIGIDPAWYNSSVCGASWCRPIFNCQTSMCSTSSPMFNFNPAPAVQYVTLDNIEFTGYQEGASGNVNPMVSVYGPYVEIENCYFHGWSHAASGYNIDSEVINTVTGNGPTHLVGESIHNNVLDGSDTSKDMMRGIFFGWDVYDNVVRYISSEIDGTFQKVYGNIANHSVTSITGMHCDNILQYGPTSGNYSYVYNNVTINTGSDCGGGVLWVNGLDSNSSAVTYAFNNVMYFNTGEGISIGGHATLGYTGVYYVYNNTLDTSGLGTGCLGNGESGSSSDTYFSNNHCIAASGGVICDGTGTTCHDQGGNLAQTEAQANADGYTSTQTYAYSPTSSSDPTVKTGVNWALKCAGPLLPMCSDTSYPTYDTTNHTVVMRKVNSRPAAGSGNWDVGAYQFSSSQTQAPQPPSGLQATVN